MRSAASLPLLSIPPTPYPSGMSADSSEVIARLLRGGTEHVVSHHGRSQYSAGGSGMSSCGLAALNCALVVLQRELGGASSEDILKGMLRRSFIEVIQTTFQVFTNRLLMVSSTSL